MLRHKHKDFILKMRKEERHFMPQVLKDLAKRIGRRGSYLLFLAMLDFLYGYSLIVVASQSRFQNPVNLILPQQAWGVIWITVGIFCLWQAFVRLDRVAFTMSVTLKIAWAAVMGFSWLFTATNPLGWISAAIFLGFGVLTGIVSYWPEPRTWKAEDFNG